VFRKDRLLLVTTMVALRSQPDAPLAPIPPHRPPQQPRVRLAATKLTAASPVSSAAPQVRVLLRLERCRRRREAAKRADPANWGLAIRSRHRERRRPEHRRPEAASSVLVPVGSDIDGQRLRVDAIDGHPVKRVASAWQSTPRARRRPRVLGRVHTDFVR
jgi:hypothetical protein